MITSQQIDKMITDDGYEALHTEEGKNLAKAIKEAVNGSTNLPGLISTTIGLFPDDPVEGIAIVASICIHIGYKIGKKELSN